VKKMSKKFGLECVENIDGSKTCKRIKAKRSGIYGTGTDVELIPDPNTCHVRQVGRVMDEDKDAIEEERKGMEDRCKRGM